MKIKYSYLVSYAFTKDRNNGFGSTIIDCEQEFITSDQISEGGFVCDHIRKTQDIKEIVIIAISRIAPS